MDTADVAGLIADFEHRDILVRYRAARELGRMGARAVPPLIEALRRGSVFVEWALYDIGAPAVRPLCGVLDDPHWVTRWTAARILGSIGDDAAVVPLCRLLRDDITPVRERAAEALARLAPPAAAPALAHALADEASGVAARAAEALVRIGPPAVEAVLPALEERRRMLPAVEVLGRIRDPRAAPALAAALGDRDRRVRRAAAGALVGVADAAAIPPLCRALEDGDGRVRVSAAAALARIAACDPAPGLRAAIPLLEEQLPPWSLGPPEALAVYREALDAVRAATAERRDLPLPAPAAPEDREALPRPAVTPDEAWMLLPHPAVAGSAVVEGWGRSPLRRLALRIRFCLRR